MSSILNLNKYYEFSPSDISFEKNTVNYNGNYLVIVSNTCKVVNVKDNYLWILVDSYFEQIINLIDIQYNLMQENDLTDMVESLKLYKTGHRLLKVNINRCEIFGNDIKRNANIKLVLLGYYNKEQLLWSAIKIKQKNKDIEMIPTDKCLLSESFIKI